jgi:hypothetical protein
MNTQITQLSNLAIEFAIRGEEISDKIVKSIHSTIFTTAKNLKSNFIELAKLLWITKEYRLWARMGYETQEDFILEVKESMGISRTDFFSLINTYEILVIEHNIPEDKLQEIGLRKAETVIKAIKCDGNIEEWISEAEHQSSDHLEIKLREMKGDPEPHKKVVTIIKTEVLIKFIQQFNEKSVDKLCETIKQIKVIKVIKDLEMGYIEMEVKK